MPTYEYLCRSCGHRLEAVQSITAGPLRKCPACGKSQLQRQISAGGGLIFKGSGFYITDYRDPSYHAAAKADQAQSDQTKPETGKPQTDKPQPEKPQTDAGKAPTGGEPKAPHTDQAARGKSPATTPSTDSGADKNRPASTGKDAAAAPPAPSRGSTSSSPRKKSAN